MSEPPLIPALVCQRCGANNPPHAVKCWICERGENPNPYTAPLLVQSPSPANATVSQSPVQWLFLGLLVACVAVAVLIGAGIAVQDTGLLIPYLIVVAPAFLATGVRAAVMVGRKETPRPSTLIFTFLWSGLFTAMALALIVVASVIAFFLWCVHMITTA